MNPGASALTRMFCGANSNANALVICTNPALETA